LCYQKEGTHCIVNSNKSKKCSCGNLIWKKSNKCFSCAQITKNMNPNNKRIFNPSKEELEDMMFNQNLTRVEISKKYDVSKAIVSMRCKEYGIPSGIKNKNIN
jgi:hypothetical protein